MRVEKRRNPRDRVNWPVTLQTRAGSIESVAYNISPGGTFIAGLSGLETQEVVGMTIKAPGSPIKVKAKVVWSTSQVRPQEDISSGMGVEFVNISDKDQEFISSFVSSSDFALYLEFSSRNGDRKCSIEEQRVEEEKQSKHEPYKAPPQECPRGHKHLSWSADEDNLFCWDCNGRYPLSECSRYRRSTS